MVCIPYGEFITEIRDCIIGAVCILLPEFIYPHWYTMLPMVHLVTQITRSLPDTVPRAEVLT